MAKFNKIKRTPGEVVGQTAIYIVMLFVIVITLYPFIYVFSMSISSADAVLRQEVWLFPVGFSLDSYKMVAENNILWTSYANTIIYTVLGTLVNITMTVMGAYALSRKDLVFRKTFMFFITLTMFFSGGMIPSFMVVNKLGIYDNMLAVILPGAVSVYNLIVARTFFEGIPISLVESAKLDGANDIGILIKIIIPLSKPILAVLALFYAVGHWNDYMGPLLYLPSISKQPLQIYLQKLLITLSSEAVQNVPSGLNRGAQVVQLRYSSIIVTTLPILFIYPFAQKYFVQGVMIGAIKE